MTNWKKYKLTQLGTLARGKSKHRPRDAAYLYGGNYPFIQTGDVKNANHRINSYSQTYSEEGLKQSKLWPKDTVCITIAANIADTAILNFPACFPDSVLGFIANKEKCDVDYIEYLLQYFQQDVQKHSIGSVQENINLGTFQNIEFPLPPLPTQSRIASILSAFDDKIELNRRMNQTLEQMAQALFNHYFVDNIDPDNLPEGWKLGSLREICQQSKDSINPTKYQTIFHQYSIPAFDNGQKPTLDAGNSILSNKFFVKSNSILFSKLNPRFPRIWLIGEIDERVSICSTEFLVFVPSIQEYWTFIYLQLSQRDVIENLINKAGGTSGSHQRVKPDDILNLEIIIPSCEILKEFDRHSKSLVQKKIENLREINILTNTRDILLPKLMSGEMDLDTLMKEKALPQPQTTKNFQPA